jgi:predicted permease
MNDLKFAIRQLLKNPGFTAVAVVSLALGIGACVAVFSIVNGVLLRSLPVPDPQDLRVLRWTGTEARLRSFSGDSTEDGGRLTGDAVSTPLFQELRERAANLADVFAFAPLNDVVVRAREAAFSSRGMVVSDNFFAALRATPLMGRLFHPADSDPDVARQVVISHEWWTRHFASDPAVCGRAITLDGGAFTIIGVLPSAFPGVRAGDGREFYAVMAPGSPFLETAATSTEHWWARLMARMKPDVGDAQLKAALDVVFARAAGGQMKSPGMLVQAGNAGLAPDRAQLRKPLMLMLGAVGVVMLATCVNLAGLSLARGAARQHELAVRAALGALRWRLIRQSLVESLTLSLVGGALGGLLSLAGAKAIARLLAGSTEGLRHDTSINFSVLGFCAATTLVTAALSGLLPALRAGRVDAVEALKTRGPLNAPRLRVGRALVAAQIGLSLVLLTGAGLYLRTVANLKNINAGFDTEKLLVFQINPRAGGYNDAQIAGFHEQLQNRLAATPGVKDATMMMNPLLDNQIWAGGFSFPNRATPAAGNLQTHRLLVGERYFSTMGIPMLQGRALSAGDDAGSFKAIVVNETFAKKYLPGENPIGQAVNFLRGNWQIVGVCGDTKYGNLKEPAPPTAYLSFRQMPFNYRASFAVRTLLPPLEVATAVRQVVASINPSIPVSRIVTQEQLRDGNISQERLFANLCGGLAGVALLLSCVGLYGLMAHNVGRRTGEIAIRMAIGAQPRRIASSFLREALALALVGIGAGLPAALGATRLIESQLYGLPAHDPLTLTLAMAVLLAVALLAAWLPARRASRVHPMVALRAE